MHQVAFLLLSNIYKSLNDTLVGVINSRSEYDWAS